MYHRKQIAAFTAHRIASIKEIGSSLGIDRIGSLPILLFSRQRSSRFFLSQVSLSFLRSQSHRSPVTRPARRPLSALRSRSRSAHRRATALHFFCRLRAARSSRDSHSVRIHAATRAQRNQHTVHTTTSLYQVSLRIQPRPACRSTSHSSTNPMAVR